MAEPYEALLPLEKPRWNSPDSLETPVKVTYSFMTEIPSYMNPEDGAFKVKLPDKDGKEKETTVGEFKAFHEDDQKPAVKQILDMIEEITNITFELDDKGGGQIQFGTVKVDDPDIPAIAWAWYPWITELGDKEGRDIEGNDIKGKDYRGDIWLDNEVVDNLKLTSGSPGFTTLLHEIGHALGLKHPHEGASTLEKDQDNRKYTVMSYQSHPSASGSSETPMPYDIEALQHLYGANTKSRTEDNTYRWSLPNAPSAPRTFISTIWDNGGIDTIDAENQLASATIDLHPGSFSSIGFKQKDNLAIFKGVIIENAIGTYWYADTIIGNDVSNSLWGRGGGDTLNGEAGNDFLYGEDGFDTLNGGADHDNLYGGIGGDTMSGGDGNDYLDGWEGDDYLYGGTESNFVGTGNDVLVAWKGSDHIYGGDGEDWLDGSYDNDFLYGGDDNDILGNPVSREGVGGEPGDDQMYGEGGNDELYGGPGNDTLDGGLGSDTMSGRADNDTYFVDDAGDSVIELFGEGTDSVKASINYTLTDHVEHLRLIDTAYRGTGNSLSNTINGNTTDNLLEGLGGNDQLYAKAGNDSLFGGDGNDVLAGEPGTDILNGEANDDSLVGGVDGDTLTGGSGKDKFIFNGKGEGIDTITDFSVVDDTIYVSKKGFGGGLTVGELKANQFFIGSKAGNSSNRFIYDKSIGGLFFDIDGKGGTGQVQIAQLSGGLAMTNKDIYVMA
jgi:Ca2+-binding RTX toxin-like protein